MKILMLSSIYPADDLSSSRTPVAHYFAKEWVKGGHTVKVFNSHAEFPKILYKLGSIFGGKFLSSFFGFTVSLEPVKDRDYEIDGVQVARRAIAKFLPHSRFSKKAIERQFEKILAFCKSSNFTPDVIAGHWLNPQLELIAKLADVFPSAKTAITLHDSAETVLKLYKNDWKELSSKLGKIGFRNIIARKNGVKELSLDEGKSYLCLSGIPDSFFSPNPVNPLSEKLNRFAFVGTLIKRKYPEALLNAAIEAVVENFAITYAGDGEQAKIISAIAKEKDVSEGVKLLGKIPRAEIYSVMENCDFLVMISRSEVYGLVYLEAMALGRIAIASRNEGFDGIIKDGENGFLCEAGNAHELAQIISRIRKMPASEIVRVSQNAIDTAKKMTDSECAKNYLDAIKS